MMCDDCAHGTTRTSRQWLLGVTLLAASAIVVSAVLWPEQVAVGWLIGLVVTISVSVGSLAWLQIHCLTGGRWGVALRPVLVPAACCTPVLALLFMPLLMYLPGLYQWADDPSTIEAAVRAWYLNPDAFTARTAIALSGWSILALLTVRRTNGAGVLLAALGLVFHAVSISYISIDWILSMAPGFISTSFGFSFAIMQLLAALAYAALVRPADDRRALHDHAALLLCTTLALAYISFMAVLVLWYGNRPSKVAWLVTRSRAPWSWMTMIALALACLLPACALLDARLRSSRKALRVLGAGVLVGLMLNVMVLLGAPHGLASTVVAVFATLTLLGGLALVIVARPPSIWRAATPARRRPSS
ncbi:MAG: hypothetical protein KDK91_01555 [Gammaproteobacteria bacterium]|nr:hypothetical protein [Gammaproteobacteria bacterium]